jgi:DNA-binding transcriptional regulator of glucitol operon
MILFSLRVVMLVCAALALGWCVMFRFNKDGKGVDPKPAIGIAVPESGQKPV